MPKKRKLFYVFSAILVSVIVCTGCGGNKADNFTYDSPAPSTDEPTWYKKVVFYQIYPRSFKDSNGDGIGDLQGIIEKLDYLQDLGIGGIWLNPIYPTQNVDLGYDITDYRDINPEFGTMEDFQLLLQEAHRRGIKIFLDLVFNHTSAAHPWFQESRQGPNNPKSDWYVWAPEPYFDCNDIPDIINTFGASRWTYDPVRGEYYFHQFYEGMPDLNFNNPEVREELLNIVRYWLDMGVDGFRLDVAHSYYENPAENKCIHQPETHMFLKDMRAVLDAYPNKAMVAEVMLFPDDIIAYLGNGHDEVHMIFNFILMTGLYTAALGGGNALLRELMEKTFDKFPPGGWHAIIIGNHDLPRSFLLVGEDEKKAKILALLQLTLPGTPFIYYGEEIGITSGSDIVVDWRDASRTPMQWDDSSGGGFTTGTAWVNLSPNYQTHNVAAEAENPESLYSFYRRLIRMRNALPSLQTGSIQFVNTDVNQVIAFVRELNNDCIAVVMNPSSRSVNVHLDLGPVFGDVSSAEVADIWNQVPLNRLTDTNVSRYALTLEPYGFRILKIQK